MNTSKNVATAEIHTLLLDLERTGRLQRVAALLGDSRAYAVTDLLRDLRADVYGGDAAKLTMAADKRRLADVAAQVTVPRPADNKMLIIRYFGGGPTLKTQSRNAIAPGRVSLRGDLMLICVTGRMATMPRVSREVSDRHKEEIEIASAKLFREHGINGISVANLMAAAGLTHGSFYSHFESKDELAALACARSFNQSARQWRTMLRDADAPGGLDKIVRRYLRDANVTGSVADCPAASLAGDVAREPDDKRVRQSFADGVNELAVTLQGALERTSQEPRRDSLTLLATLVGTLLLARATAGTELSAEIQQGAIARISEDYE